MIKKVELVVVPKEESQGLRSTFMVDSALTNSPSNISVH